MSPKEKAVQLCDMVYHSSMGDKWHIFVISRATQIANELMRYCDPRAKEDGIPMLDFFKQVIEEIGKMK